MPSWFWIGLWVVAIGVVAVLYVREKRSGRRIGEGDRFQHEAVRQAQADASMRGPNGGGQTFMG
ncbi:hypothetical protein [Nocardioides aurantiacus]|uniref:hypothetical protein n=1 Tax=Nocardioides aurantiacus TaxID=86796 RepID=UPI00403F0256